ncbi:MAG: theronine dehydrogenase [Rhodospirillaceae bacterium]|nr:theronine dehydrogenase [Rhodospirillaceae bacterium]|tara:strand:+ start:25212 stop:27377 length:2166 start_codon:yes stop_codon:yes gene_type:complete
MKQIVQSARSGKLALKEVPDPKVRSGHVLVRTRTSLISAGTERMVVQFAKKSLAAKAKARPDLVRKVLDKTKRDGIAATLRAVMARLDEPLPLGYSACGDVIAVGDGIEGKFQVGQRIAIAGAGLANHADYNVVPVNLAAPVPEDVNDEEACFGTLGSIALHGVRNMELEFGDCAAVIGAGLVGQLAAQLLELAGIRVAVFDYDSGRLDLARYGRAEMTWNLANGDPTEAVMDFTQGRGCDGVLIAAATDSSEPFNLAANIARDRARVSLVGITGTEVPYREFMHKELSVVVSRSYGPGRYDPDFEGRGMKYPLGWVPWTETRNLEEVVRRMTRASDHRLAVEPLISHRFDFDKAEEAYALVTEKSEPHLGVVLNYGQQQKEPVSGLRIPIAVSGGKKAGDCVLGVVGAGSFARTMLLPRLKNMKNCRLHTIATQRGISAEHSQETFGFEFSAADEAAVFDNDDINAVLITTPHSSHAALTAEALAAGKNVLVEKPLALDREQLNSVIEARNKSDAFFQVGFNRRFAPMAIQMRDRLAELPAPRVVLLRVNAGQLPKESWQNAPEEGNGRILGEMCHFVDLARFLIGSPISSVQAAAASATRGACDDVTATLGFTDGSLATIAYTAKGDTAFSKELFEAYAGGVVIMIDNFRSITIVSDGSEKKSGAGLDQDKGHKGELEAFVEATANGGPAPVDEAEIVEVSLATIAIGESLRTGAPVAL